MCWLIASATPARGADRLPEFPPGVRFVEELPAEKSLPAFLEIRALEVDWTEPLLAVDLQLGTTSSDALPMKWDKVAGGDPDALKIQLAEPIETDAGWEVRPPANRVEQGVDWVAESHVRIGGIVPWSPGGEFAQDRMGGVPPLALSSFGSVSATWLGQAKDWAAAPPSIEFRASYLLSTLDTASGKSMFLYVSNRGSARANLDALSGWIEAAFSPEVWIAAHFGGKRLHVGQGGWRMDPPSQSRARAGAVLVLKKKSEGDEVDWARFRGVRAKASSFTPLHPAASVTRGLLWPDALAPNVWASRMREGDREGSDAWLSLDLGDKRSVREIRIVYPSAAGFSRHFNPAAVTLDVWARKGSRPEHHFSIDTEGHDFSSVLFPEPIVLRSLEVRMPAALEGAARSPTRLMAVQVLGPWDGIER